MSFDGRSSSASSIDSTGSFETLQEPRDLKLQRLEAEVSLLKKEIQDKRTEAQELNESTLKAQISGEWKIVASRNVEEFLKKRGGSEVDDIVFQLADIHFQFDDFQKVTVFHKIGNKQYHRKDLSFDRSKWSNGTCSMTYFTEKSMKTVDDVLAEQEVSVEDGNLKIVEKVGEVCCERIYRRRTEEDPTNVEDLTSKVMEKQELQQLVEKLQKDLKEQCVELDKKCKESVEQKVENKNLKSKVLKLQSDLKEQSREKDVEIEKLKSSVLEIKEEKFQKALEELLNSQKAEEPDIKKAIVGTWRDKKDAAETIDFKIDEQGNILQKWYHHADFTVYIPGVRDVYGWTFYFKNNRLVEKKTNPNGTTIFQADWFLDDGELILASDFTRTVFEKI